MMNSMNYSILGVCVLFATAALGQQQPQPPVPGAWGSPTAKPVTQTAPNGPQVAATPPVPAGTVPAGQARGQQPQRRLPIPIAPPTVREVVKTTVDAAGDTILSPSDVGRIKDSMMRARQRQVTPSYPGNSMPKPVSRTIAIDPDPAQQPKMVRLSQSTITSFVFSDLAGAPWIIDSRSFDPSMFSDGTTGCGQQAGGREATRPSNILNLQPCDPYAFGNIVVTLKGFPAPVVFMLATGQANEVDVRVSARVRGVNPDARAEIVQAESMPEHDSLMQDFLDGVPPPSAKALKMNAGVGQVWVHGGAMYLRTRMQVYSPAFRAHVGSAEGTHVYKFNRPEPYVIVSAEGKPETISIAGY
jgi:intracellular multiplication protein IcmK